MCEQCAKKVVGILDQMEEGGEFKGLSVDEKEIERQTMGMRLRGDMRCPETGVLSGEAGEPDPPATVTEPVFHQELETLINRHSMENNSDTPDFILARFMRSCLRAFDHGVRERNNWYRKEQDPRQDTEHPQIGG
jgi:hypothetical protein